MRCMPMGKRKRLPTASTSIAGWAGIRLQAIDFSVLLKDVDIGPSTSPQLDRRLDYVNPLADRALMTFEQRGTYDRDILNRLFSDLPRGWMGKVTDFQTRAHRWFVSMARRRYFFECRDDERWRQMLPYRAAWRLLDFVERRTPAMVGLYDVLSAINRGEGLVDPERLHSALALQVRTVEGGSIRSYRLFPTESLPTGSVG